MLDQELQKYNLLIGTMTDTLQAALNVIDGKSLVTNQVTHKSLFELSAFQFTQSYTPQPTYHTLK